MAQEISYLSTEVGILTKRFSTMNSKKVNTVGTQGKASRLYNLDMNEEAKYLDRELVSEPRSKHLLKVIGTLGKGTKVGTIIRIGT